MYVAMLTRLLWQIIINNTYITSQKCMERFGYDYQNYNYTLTQVMTSIVHWVGELYCIHTIQCVYIITYLSMITNQDTLQKLLERKWRFIDDIIKIPKC